MPLRRRDNDPRKNVTLKEALDWIAFNDFAGPPMTNEEAVAKISGDVDNVEVLEIEYFMRYQSLNAAEDDLFAALRDGDIRARGRFSNTYANALHESEWQEQDFEGHSSARDDIPTEFWWREGMAWEANRVKSPHGEYVDIILDRKAVLSLWPLEDTEAEVRSEQSHDLGKQRTSQKRGPKERYSERDFFALCAWEAAANDLPKTQAELVGRMAQLCAVVWGENKVPGEMWLKEKIGYLYKQRENYELGRQEIDGEANSDRSEVGE